MRHAIFLVLLLFPRNGVASFSLEKQCTLLHINVRNKTKRRKINQIWSSSLLWVCRVGIEAPLFVITKVKMKARKRNHTEKPQHLSALTFYLIPVSVGVLLQMIHICFLACWMHTEFLMWLSDKQKKELFPIILHTTNIYMLQMLNTKHKEHFKHYPVYLFIYLIFN